jgi:outer membrane protein OmpA-like peptidoglycan-associated protein
LAFGLLAAAASGSAGAQNMFDQDWVLNPRLSHVYLQTVKNNAIFETHQFTVVEGGVDKNGEASVRIDLASLETGIDIRNVRMRFLLFETYKFPYAQIGARLDKDTLQPLAIATRIAYPLELTVAMHGMVNAVKAMVWVTRIDATTVSVSTIQPIIVATETFGLTGGLAKLAEAVGGIPIAAGASLTFDLLFATGKVKPDLEAARSARQEQRAEAETRAIPAEGCEARFNVLSRTSAIYFKPASAELAEESAPVLGAVADIAKRCPTVKIDVEGHTDNVGSKERNQRLSEQRAKAVADYLTGKGVDPARIHSAGFGDTRPIAANDSEANRARNRRIEFTVRKE